MTLALSSHSGGSSSCSTVRNLGGRSDETTKASNDKRGGTFDSIQTSQSPISDSSVRCSCLKRHCGLTADVKVFLDQLEEHKHIKATGFTPEKERKKKLT